MEDQEDLSYDEILQSLENFKGDMESEFGISLDDTPEGNEEPTKTVSTQKQLEHIDQLLNNLQYKQKEWENMNNFNYVDVQQNQFKLPLKSKQTSQLSDNDSKRTENDNLSEKLSDNEFKELSTEEKARRLLSDLDSSFIIEIDEVHLFNKLSTSGYFDEGEDLSKAIQSIKKERLDALNNLQTLEEEQIAMDINRQNEIDEQQVKMYEERYIQLQEQRQMLEEQKALLENLKENATQEDERQQIEERQKKIDDQLQIQEEQLQDHSEKEKHIESIREKLKKDQEERQRNFEERKKLWQKSVNERTRHSTESPSSSLISNSPDSLHVRTDSLKRIYRRSMASIKNIKTESSPNKFRVSQKELIKPSKEFIQSIIQKIIPNPNIGKNGPNSSSEDKPILYTIVHREDSERASSFGNEDSVPFFNDTENQESKEGNVLDKSTPQEENIGVQPFEEQNRGEEAKESLSEQTSEEQKANAQQLSEEQVEQHHEAEEPQQEDISEEQSKETENNIEIPTEGIVEDEQSIEDLDDLVGDVTKTENITTEDQQHQIEENKETSDDVQHTENHTESQDRRLSNVEEFLDAAINTLDSLDTIIETKKPLDSLDTLIETKEPLDSLDTLIETKELNINDYFKNEQESREFLNKIINLEMNSESFNIETNQKSIEDTQLLEGMDEVLDSFLKNSE